MQRIVLHLDLDAFFAQAEELRNPSLKGKEVVVCMFSGRGELGGAVGAANYAARKKGLHAGMSIARAKEKAPEAEFLPADIGYYKEISEKVHAILEEYAEKTQSLGLDEAYLEIGAQVEGDFDQAKALALKIKEQVHREVGLTCSVGIGPNKLVAKIASDFQKPDGLTVVPQQEVRSFLNPLPVTAIPGVGAKTASVLEEWGISTIEELARVEGARLVEAFGKSRGGRIHQLARGVDDSPVEEREKKQLSCIATLLQDTREHEALEKHISGLAEKVLEKARAEKVKFSTVSLVIVLAGNKVLSRARTLENPTDSLQVLTDASLSLLHAFLKEQPEAVLRRAGVSVSGFTRTRGQKSLADF